MLAQRTKRGSRFAGLLPLVLVLLTPLRSSALPPAAEGSDVEEKRLEAMRVEIDRLRVELDELRQREAGILDTIDRLAAEQRLREAELREIGLRIATTERAIRAGAARLAEIVAKRESTARYLEFRLRETYKRGAGQSVRRALGGLSGQGGYFEGLRYSTWLSERDAVALREYRERTVELEAESAALEGRRADLERARREATGARDALALATRRRERLLEEIRSDAARREEALAELRAASEGLSALVAGIAAEGGAPELDIVKFRGLLDPPVPGPVSSDFGAMVHPRFRTKVPHPGLDIDAEAGRPFHSVFDGTVLFASWLRGYGLTAIVDHGGEVLSIYSHASVLLVEQGEWVARGQELGRVGDTGSLRGPYLYFEMREAGRPVDPQDWLRGR